MEYLSVDGGSQDVLSYWRPFDANASLTCVKGIIPIQFVDERKNYGEIGIIAIGEKKMAIVHKSGQDLKGRVNQSKLDATTENDIRRDLIEDGFDPDNPFEGLREIIVSPQHPPGGIGSSAAPPA